MNLSWCRKSTHCKSRVKSVHRRDSIQVTDYVANYFFMNLKVSRVNIEDLK